MLLEGHVAIITGAGAGLGRTHALELARHGARIVVNDMAGAAAATVVAEIEAAGGAALAATGSVTDETAVAEMVEAALGRWGKVDILVNNAGILRDASFAKMTLDDFRAVVDVHLMGAVICCKAVWPGMRERGYGRIVMTTSSSGLFGNFGQANYGAAKMALVGLMQTLAIEGAKYDIRVNALAPTATTAMTDALFSPAMKALLEPGLVSPGLVRLVAPDAPTRAILCGGAGHFERAYVTYTNGAHIGDGADAAGRVADAWEAIGDRDGADAPDDGSAQIQRELTAVAKARGLA